MFSNDPLQSGFAATSRFGIQADADPNIVAARAAVALYNRMCNRARLERFWSLLIGRRCALVSLADIERQYQIHNRYRLGLQTVPIRSICGSEERCGDFDLAFRPRNPSCRSRWLAVAVARQLGISLPPVDLIEIDQFYFVRDGHHRISVARAMGQLEIEADVVSWQVDLPKLWNQRAAPRFRPGHGRVAIWSRLAASIPFIQDAAKSAEVGDSAAWSPDQGENWTPR